MYTVIETYHNENGSWGNRHEDFDTLTEAQDYASSLPESSSIEIVDDSGETVLPLSYPVEA
jgi:hypothetical protein